MSTTTELLQEIDDLLGGGSPKVLKAEHQPLLNKIANSLLNKETDINLLGLLKHDPNKTYLLGEGVLKDGQLWQANQNIAVEAWNLAKWVQITGIVGLSDYGIAEWDAGHLSGAGYSTGNQVVRDERLWVSDIDSNTADPLVSDWTEISANDGTFGNDYAVGLYKNRQVVTNPADQKLYYVAAASNFNSVDIAVEIGTGDFVLFHDVGVNLSGTQNSMAKFGASGDLEETDEIKVVGSEVQLKTLLKLLTGAKIERVDENGDIINRSGKLEKIIATANNGIYIVGKDDFTKGWAGSDDNGAGIGFGSESFYISAGGIISFTKGASVCSLSKSLITAARQYTFPNKDGVFAMLEDVLYLQKVNGGLAYVDNPLATVITAIATPVKINQTWTLTQNGTDFSEPIEGRLQYNGATDIVRNFLFSTDIVKSGSGTNRYELELFKNGVAISGFKSSVSLSTSFKNISLIVPNINLTSGDYFEVFVTNTAGTGNLGTDNGQLITF